MKNLLRRLGSPAGFGLALLLFLVLPFVSVSCEMPGVGEAGAGYTGADVAFDTEPTVQVPDLGELGAELPGGEGSDQPPPDPGAELLAIIAGALLVVGIGTVVITRVRTRLLATAVVALLAAAMMVMTQIVAQSNLTTALLDEAKDTGAAESPLGDVDAMVGELVHTEPAFWLVVILLALIAALNAIAVFPRRASPSPGTGESISPDP